MSPGAFAARPCRRAIIGVTLAFVFLGALAYAGCVAVLDRVERMKDDIHSSSHTGPNARKCGCGVGVEEMRAEVLEARDMVAQRLDAIESRCVWLGPHRVPVMKVAR